MHELWRTSTPATRGDGGKQDVADTSPSAPCPRLEASAYPDAQTGQEEHVPRVQDYTLSAEMANTRSLAATNGD